MQINSIVFRPQTNSMTKVQYNNQPPFRGKITSNAKRFMEMFNPDKKCNDTQSYNYLVSSIDKKMQELPDGYTFDIRVDNPKGISSWSDSRYGQEVTFHAVMTDPQKQETELANTSIFSERNRPRAISNNMNIVEIISRVLDPNHTFWSKLWFKTFIGNAASELYWKYQKPDKTCK